MLDLVFLSMHYPFILLACFCFLFGIQGHRKERRSIGRGTCRRLDGRVIAVGRYNNVVGAGANLGLELLIIVYKSYSVA